MNARYEIGEILREEVDRASKKYQEAKLAFWRISSDLPLPDGIQRITIASRAQGQAMEALVRALARLNAFLIDGIVPQDLRKSDQSDFPWRGDGSLSGGRK